jgi:hypothetical protein
MENYPLILNDVITKKNIYTNDQTNGNTKSVEGHIGISYLAGARSVAEAFSIVPSVAYRHTDSSTYQTYEHIYQQGDKYS